MPGVGSLGHRIDAASVRELRLEDGVALVGESIAVPLHPSIGCIGVAPASAPGSTMGPAGPWGGNMDLRELVPGATLLLPVQVEGALLCLGDLHAAMGAGEPTGAGFESAGRATIRLDVIRDMELAFPRILSDGATICVGMDETHPLARRRAMEQAHQLLVERGLDPLDAYAYLSAEAELRLGGPASPIVLAVVRFP
jgi:amidase